MADLMLELVEGEEVGRQVALTGSLEIGRDHSMALAIDDPEASRRHASVTLRDGRVLVEDLGSTNGTYVNDRPIHTALPIVAGDRVRVGLTVFELRDPAQGADRPALTRAVPQITVVAHEVLQPAPAPPPPGFLAEESEPEFVPREVIGDREAEANYAAVQRLVDTRVKRQTNTAVFALLGAAGIAVLLAFGLK